MRILSIQQPWAWLILHAGKDVENRPTNIVGAYRGEFAIQASIKWDTYAAYDARVRRAVEQHFGDTARLDDPRHHSDVWAPGHIVGTASLADIHKVNGESGENCCWSLWAEPDAGFHIEVRDPKPLAVPIRWKGALGLRALTDPEVLAAIRS